MLWRDAGSSLFRRRGGGWSAKLLPAGSFYLEHGDYPDGHWARKRRGGATLASPTADVTVATPKPRPVARPKPPAPQRPSADTAPSRRLLAELQKAGGVLERDASSDGTKYHLLVGAINRHQLAPAGHEVISYSGAERDQVVIRLVERSEWKTDAPAEVASRERIGRWHPVVAKLRSDGKLDKISKVHQRRGAVLLHCLATEAEARGYRVSRIESTRGTGYYSQRDTPKGLICLTTPGGHDCHLGLKQYLDRTDHVPTEKELAEAKQWSWYQPTKYDYAPSSRLAVVTYSGTGYYDKEWGDTKKRHCAEGRLDDILAAIAHAEVIAADMRERRQVVEERRARRIERENEQARAAYIEHATGEKLKADAIAWEKAERLRAYVQAMRLKADAIPDGSDREAAEKWVAWCDRFVDTALDPLQQPLRRPDVAPATDKDIAEFRCHLGFDRQNRW